jgi:hypothetical protein
VRAPDHERSTPNSDFYQYAELLNAEELHNTSEGAHAHGKVAPIINNYWAEDAFPFASTSLVMLCSTENWEALTRKLSWPIRTR